MIKFLPLSGGRDLYRQQLGISASHRSVLTRGNIVK